MNYYKNPSRQAPKSLQKHIFVRQEENDPHLKYVRKNYVNTGDEADCVPVVEVSSGYTRPSSEDEKTTARRMGVVMKRLKVKKGVRDIYPTRIERNFTEDGWESRTVEDRSVKAKPTKVWTGLRKKTELELEQEEE
jgi:hypothetical protein